MSEIFIIKNTGKGVINSLAPENVVSIKSAGSSDDGVITEDSDTVAFTGNGTVGMPLIGKVKDIYSTTETLTGGTWIDGKPIYIITQLTADTPPTMETVFPTEVIGTYTVYKYTKP